jgi:two-component system phosphate regulon sensor histidine kinase PhoR
MHPRRLLWQLYPTYLLITLASLLAVGLFAAVTLRDFHKERTKDSLETAARAMEDAILARLAANDYAQLDAFCKKLGPATRMRITVLLPSGEVVGDSLEAPAAMDNHADREEIRKALEQGLGSATRFSYTLRQDMLYVAVPLQQGGKPLGVLRTAMPTTEIAKALAAIHLRIGLAGLVVALAAASVSLLVARRISRPLEEIQHGAERFARGDLQHKLPIPPLHEAAALAETMNDMAAQLDARIHDVIRQRNEREAILASMVEGLLAVDLDERLLSLNQAACRLLSLELDKAQGRTLQEVVRNRELQRLVSEVLSRQLPVAKDLEIVSREGEKRQLHAQGTVLYDSQNRPLGALVVLHDITRLKKLENVRRDFVANVSHELKTPVTSIKGFVETLLDGAMHNPADAERFLRIVASQADRLNSIIEDLLTLSRLEQGAEKAEIALEPSPIRHVLTTAAEVCQLKAAAKQIQVEIACDEGLCTRINAALLEQAVVNLVDNAIKYSPKGQQVQVAAFPDNGEIVIRVADQGCGIPKEHLPRIFERFYRVDRARSRELGGTGLGLAIVKHIAQVHGGHATVKSTVGEGSVFCIHLPACGT